MKKRRRKAEEQEKKDEREQIVKQIWIAVYVFIALDLVGFYLDIKFLMYLAIIPGIFVIIASICLVILDQE